MKTTTKIILSIIIIVVIAVIFIYPRRGEIFGSKQEQNTASSSPQGAQSPQILPVDVVEIRNLKS
jgi:membrane fusion protein (multidrug efflux system)